MDAWDREMSWWERAAAASAILFILSLTFMLVALTVKKLYE